ncbi:methyltransferase domain-containing protein [Thalassotalea sp. 1_MG-2023]|uniref:class I SAM-dependent methyltransferase n=1 Tax=Thalassotalea sp. 1_MG-2023 TaxID=3062680 RepID=UPI0026E2333A|nr:methyltransferase domain-containing protein [Thalassotalea sp. 1_MG-2023]MDO6427790.1 methyltransferase domain-containing protein [Thalassotalea sp. 1_MG-2023]
MKPALSFRQPHSPSSWEKLPNGELIVESIDTILAPWWPKFFGYHLLKIGALSHHINTSASTIQHQVTISEHKPHADINAEIEDLPLLEHSVDVCLLSHVLEFTLDPHHVIREANRVLIPNGYLVITGYNAFSLAGLNSFVPYRRQQPPWNERFFSPLRVKDWLDLMGYEILADERCLHSMLANNVSQHLMARQWRQFTQRYLSSLGSIFVIVAKKRVLPLTPIKPKWKLKPKLAPINVSSVGSKVRHTKKNINN